MTRVAFVVAVVTGLVGLFLFGLLRGSPDRDIASNYLDKPVPDFALPVYEQYRGDYGDTFTLSETLGAESKPVIINFWSPSCPPCYQEAPELQRAWQAYRDDVLIVGVNTRDRDKAGGRDFIEQFNLTFPNVMDADNTLMIEYGLFGLPETFFVRADGTLAYKHVGPVTMALLEEQVEALIQ